MISERLRAYGFSPNLIEPFGYGSNGVLILGEAPGEQEDSMGVPFVPFAPSGSILERAIRKLGSRREQFVVTNSVPYRPPKNWLDGAPWEVEAIESTRPILEDTLTRYRPRCIVCLGGVATRLISGLAGHNLGVSYLTGFVLPSLRYNIPCIPCFHPAYLRRGKMSHFGLLLRALRLAMQVAREGRKLVTPPVDTPPPGYIMYPDEQTAKDFYERARQHPGYIAYDIETPYSTEEDGAEESEGVHVIRSIQFSLAPESGIFLPWKDPFIGVARAILALRNPKLGWNIWRFDDPILKANGCEIAGDRHDLMWAWHHNQPDIPRGLQFAASQSGWPWPWKHLDSANPRFYGIVDVDVLQWMVS